MPTEIHPTAVVDPKAEIGQDVTIGPYAVVEAEVTVGDGCTLEAFSIVKRHTVLGRDNHVHSYACIGDAPQDLSFKGEPTRVVVGDGNAFREHVTVNRGTPRGRSETSIGSNCLLMAYSHVAHDCILGDNVVMANAATLAGHVQVGHHAIISGLSALQQYCRVGEYAFLGGMSGYPKDVPPFMFANGARARLYGPNLVGLKRNGFSKEAIMSLKKAYRMLFRTELIWAEALEATEKEFSGSPEVMRLIEFLRESKAGVTPDKSKKNGD